MSARREAIEELCLNLVAPTVVLIWMSGPERLGPALALILALTFPLAHIALSLWRSWGSGLQISPLAAIALPSILLTGGIGLFELDTRWFAWKEASFPLVMGLAAIGSTATRWPAIPFLLSRLLDMNRLNARLQARGTARLAERRMLRTTWALGAWMMVSALLTFALARALVHSPTGTPGFNEELGRYTAWSFPAVGLPVALGMAWSLRGLLLGLEEDAGTPIEELLPATDPEPLQEEGPLQQPPGE